ncbi:MAG: tape measure protein [Acidobacteria bacterium]|nr:tape measure protein [Acidobacteriota bacterium]
MDFKLRYQIQADGRQAKAELTDVERAIDRMSKRAASSSSGMGAVFGGSLAADAFSRITAGAEQAGTAVFNFTSRLEQSRIAFTTLIGNAAATTKHLDDLRKLATQTPLSLQSLTSMSQRLQGAGIQLERIVPLIREIGNTAAATGELTAERMEGISLAFSQVVTKGKVSAEEMNQLAERGIPAWRILSEQLGKSAAELQKMAKDGELSAEVLCGHSKISRGLTSAGRCRSRPRPSAVRCR